MSGEVFLISLFAFVFSKCHNQRKPIIPGSLGAVSGLCSVNMVVRCSGLDLSSSDGRHKPVHIPWVCGVSQVTPSVADRTCSTAILGERA